MMVETTMPGATSGKATNAKMRGGRAPSMTALS